MSDLTKHYRQLLGIAKTWAEKNLTGWCDDLHRNLLARHGAVSIEGRVSASSMNMPQLAAALEDYERRGWPRQNGYTPKGQAAATRKPVPPRIANMFKLWGKLGQSGKITNATRQGLLKFCSRQVARTVEDLDALSTIECQTITEALKGWLAR